jgi:hypothetical protein
VLASRLDMSDNPIGQSAMHTTLDAAKTNTQADCARNNLPFGHLAMDTINQFLTHLSALS